MEVLLDEGQGRGQELLREITRRKLQYLRHVVRGNMYRLLYLVWKTKRKETNRKTEDSWLKSLREGFGNNSAVLFRRAAAEVEVAGNTRRADVM